MGSEMCIRDRQLGDPIDCFAFAKRYEVIVIIYACGVNVQERFTLVFDGRLNQRSTAFHAGICPDLVQVSSDVLELVRYRTALVDLKKKGVGKGRGHYVYVRRPPQVPVNQATMQTRAQGRSSDARGGDSPPEDKC